MNHHLQISQGICQKMNTNYSYGKDVLLCIVTGILQERGHFLAGYQAAWHRFCCTYNYSLLIRWEYTREVIARVYVFTGCAKLCA